MHVLTAGTARAVFQHFRTRDYFLDDQLLPTPHLYFLYFESIFVFNHMYKNPDNPISNSRTSAMLAAILKIKSPDLGM